MPRNRKWNSNKSHERNWNPYYDILGPMKNPGDLQHLFDSGTSNNRERDHGSTDRQHSTDSRPSYNRESDSMFHSIDRLHSTDSRSSNYRERENNGLREDSYGGDQQAEYGGNFNSRPSYDQSSSSNGRERETRETNGRRDDACRGDQCWSQADHGGNQESNSGAYAQPRSSNRVERETSETTHREQDQYDKYQHRRQNEYSGNQDFNSVASYAQSSASYRRERRAASPSRNDQQQAQYSRDTPPWLPAVNAFGAMAGSVESRYQVNKGTWDWIKNQVLSRKIVDNFLKPLPVQDKTCAAISEGVDVLLRVPSSYGRTTAWMISLLDRVTSSDKPTARTLKHIVICKNEESAARMGHQLNLLIPRDENAVRSVDVRWYWQSIKRANTYQQLARRGGEILICTLEKLLDLLADPPFDPRKVETLILDEFDGITTNQMWQGSRWWNESVKTHFGQDLQTIVVGRSGKEHHDGREILRSNNVNIDANDVKDTVIPRHDFLMALSDQEEEDELIRAIHRLRTEANGRGIAVFLEFEEDAIHMYGRLKERGFDKVGRLSRIKVDDDWTCTMNQFRLGKLDILICSYQMEKIVDTPGQADIYVGLPDNLSTYIFRVTRNGRVRSGRSVTILREKEQQLVTSLKEKLTLHDNAIHQLQVIGQAFDDKTLQLSERLAAQEDLRTVQEHLRYLEEHLREIDLGLEESDEQRRQHNERAFD